MRHVLTLAAIVAAAEIAGAQGTFVARFSESQWREPTFVVSRPAYVGVFELLDGGRIAQRYPRVEAQNEFALPAGETALSYLDVPIGRLTDAPGTRTVFFNSGGYGARPVATGAAPMAHTLILVASSAPLRIGPSAEFPALAAKQLAATDSSLSRHDRALAAVLALVRPASGDAQMATEVSTLWSIDYKEYRGLGRSIAAGDPLPGTYNRYREGGYGGDGYRSGACGGYGIGVITTYSSEYACGREAVWMGGGWAYDIGAGYVPYLPIYFRNRRSPGSTTPENKPVGVFPGQRVTPTGPQGGGVRVSEPPIEQVPALRGRWTGSIAGAGEMPMAPASPAAMGGGGGGGGGGHAMPTAQRYSGPVFVAPASASPPARPLAAGGATQVAGPTPILVAPAAAPAPVGGKGVAPAGNAAHPAARPAPAPVKKQ